MLTSFNVRFSLAYFSVAVSLFILEVLIAKFMHGWMRSYLGDVFVVMLIYGMPMSVINVPKLYAVLVTLLTSYFVESLQYFHVAALLGFESGSIGFIVLGNTFSLVDILCYSLGCMLIVLAEYTFDKFYA